MKRTATVRTAPAISSAVQMNPLSGDGWVIPPTNLRRAEEEISFPMACQTSEGTHGFATSALSKRSRSARPYMPRPAHQPRTLAVDEWSPPTITRAHIADALARVSRGVHRVAEVGSGFCVDIGTVAARTPRGVVCLLSAAHIHGLVPQPPAEVWLALPGGLTVSSAEKPQARTLHWTFPCAFTEGVVVEGVGGTLVRMTDLARTVVDLVRQSRQVGGDEVGIVAGQAFVLGGGSCDRLTAIATVTGAPAVVARVIRFLETIYRPSPFEKELQDRTITLENSRNGTVACPRGRG